MTYNELVQENKKAIRDYVGDIKGMLSNFARSDRSTLRTYGLMEEPALQTSRVLSSLPTEKVLSAADQIMEVVNSLDEKLQRGPTEQTETSAMLALNSVAVLEADFLF